MRKQEKIIFKEFCAHNLILCKLDENYAILCRKKKYLYTQQGRLRAIVSKLFGSNIYNKNNENFHRSQAQEIRRANVHFQQNDFLFLFLHTLNISI